MIIYLLIAVLPVFVELSPNVCTAGFIRKICLAMLSVGGIVALNGKGADLICIAIAILYLEKMRSLLIIT